VVIVLVASVFSTVLCCRIKGIAHRRFVHRVEAANGDGEPILSTKFGYQPLDQPVNSAV